MTAYAQADWQAFATDVYCEFLTRTCQPETRLMTALEFWCVRRWLMDGIPLRIVLRGLRDCQGKGRTLTYYDGAVRQAWAYWLKAVPEYSGISGQLPAATPEEVAELEAWARRRP